MSDEVDDVVVDEEAALRVEQPPRDRKKAGARAARSGTAGAAGAPATSGTPSARVSAKKIKGSSSTSRAHATRARADTGHEETGHEETGHEEEPGESRELLPATDIEAGGDGRDGDGSQR